RRLAVSAEAAGGGGAGAYRGAGGGSRDSALGAEELDVAGEPVRAVLERRVSESVRDGRVRAGVPRVSAHLRDGELRRVAAGGDGWGPARRRDRAVVSAGAGGADSGGAARGARAAGGRGGLRQHLLRQRGGAV